MAKKGRKPSRTSRERLLKKGAEIGDAMVFVCIFGLEMLTASVEILNRLRRAEKAVTGEDVFGIVAWGRPEIPLCADIQDALLSHKEMARSLPLDVIREQRLFWEAEVARFAVLLHTPSFRARLEERSRRWRAARMLAKGDANRVQRKATLTKIAEELKIEGRDPLRQVRRILRENEKGVGGVFDVDRRLLSRDLLKMDELPDKTLAENVLSIGRNSRRKRP